MSFFRIFSLFVSALFYSNLTFAQNTNFLKLTSDTVIYISRSSSMVRMVFEVKEGFYIQSNVPVNDTVISSEIFVKWPQKMSALDPIFPQAEEIFLEGSSNPVPVFSGKFQVTIALHFKEDIIKGAYQIPAKIKYQACDNKRYFNPRELPFYIDLVID